MKSSYKLKFKRCKCIHSIEQSLINLDLKYFVKKIEIGYLKSDLQARSSLFPSNCTIHKVTLCSHKFQKHEHQVNKYNCIFKERSHNHFKRTLFFITGFQICGELWGGQVFILKGRFKCPQTNNTTNWMVLVDMTLFVCSCSDRFIKWRLLFSSLALRRMSPRQEKVDLASAFQTRPDTWSIEVCDGHGQKGLVFTRENRVLKGPLGHSHRSLHSLDPQRFAKLHSLTPVTGLLTPSWDNWKWFQRDWTCSLRLPSLETRPKGGKKGR